MWGRSDVGQLGLDKKCLQRDTMGWVALNPVEVVSLHGEVRRIALGEAHTLVLVDKGELYAAGWNEFGQRGSVNEIEEFELVKKVTDNLIVSISAGSLFSVAVDNQGIVYTWGNNEYGQLGCKSINKHENEPRTLKLEKVLEVSCGETSATAYCTSGNVYSWGKNSLDNYEEQSILVSTLDTTKYYALNPKSILMVILCRIE